MAHTIVIQNTNTIRTKYYMEISSSDYYKQRIEELKVKKNN